ncbi:MAG: TonB-dependent receptor plug domain-containing protein [Ignavibacteria bacterium]
MKILFLFILFFLSQNLSAQNNLTDTIRKTPFDTNKIKEAVYLSKTSDVFSYDSLYIWNDKRSLSEIMDQRPGYFIYDFGLGGRNKINYNNRTSDNVGIFRDGIPMNDRLFGDFDIQNISINEIDRIEEISNVSSFFYGINSSAKVINIISKDIFQSKPFSQLRFSQDREGSLFADVLFSQPFSRKMNAQLGVTKHSLDGRYANSEFNIWRGRARINLFLSPKFNTKLNFYLDNYNRELSNGLIYSPDKDSLFDPTLARVIHPNTNEHLENYYYDATITARLFKNPGSLTNLKIYSTNSIRMLVNPDDSSITYKNLPSSYFHTILYGLSLDQNLKIVHGRKSRSEIVFGGDVYLNYFNSNIFENQNTFNTNYYSLRAKYDFVYNFLSVVAMIRNDNIDQKNYLNAGMESSLKIFSDNTKTLTLYGGANRIKYNMNEVYGRIFDGYEQAYVFATPLNLFEAGFKFSIGNFSSNILAYRNHYDRPYKGYNGINAALSFINRNIDITTAVDYAEYEEFPKYYVKAGFAYKDILFRNKLKIKTGIDLKYFKIEGITNQYQTLYLSLSSSSSFPQQNQFIADFYIGARIGRANINLTLANIFNSLVYNAYIFPLDDRGGFGNVVSRFTIVWDFIN